MPHRPPVPPPPELVERIKREVAEPGFLRNLLIWSERQVGKLLSIEGRSDPHMASALVNDAIVDTCDGVRRWDPVARTLRRHLEQTVNSRLWHECERSRRRRHIALDTVSVDDSRDDAPSIDIEMSLRREDPRTRPDGLYAQHEVRAKVLDELRTRAVDDSGVLALLASHEAGYHREGEACGWLGLTLHGHRNVVRRLRTLQGRVPAELRADMRDMLVRDGGPPAMGVARCKGRMVEIIADETVPAEDTIDELSVSGDGDSCADKSRDGFEREAAGPMANRRSRRTGLCYS